jgi:hypothetical protein
MFKSYILYSNAIEIKASKMHTDIGNVKNIITLRIFTYKPFDFTPPFLMNYNAHDYMSVGFKSTKI